MVFRRRTLSLAIATPLLCLLPSTVLHLTLRPLPALAQQTRHEELETQANRLYEEGNRLQDDYQHQAALVKFQRALEIYQEIDDRLGAGITLNNIGGAYDVLGQYEQALDSYEQSLAIHREIDHREREGLNLSNVGAVYENLGQYDQALEYYDQALTISTEIDDLHTRGMPLLGIGSIHYSLEQYGQALDHYQQSLTIFQKLGNQQDESAALNAIGAVYNSLGQYGQALSYHQQSLSISQESGSRQQEGIAFNSIGFTYHNLGHYEQALNYYQKSLAIRQEIGDRQAEGTILNNIGGVYDAQGQHEQAMHYYQQSLAIGRDLGDRTGEGITLGNLGNSFFGLQNYRQAITTYHLALTIARETGDRSTEGIALSNIGNVLVTQKQPELGIIFYKQAINIWESMRENIRELPQELQQSFTDTVADSYHVLADLLLQHDRVLEAQQILDLLKVQELEDYLQDVRGNAKTANGVSFWQPEQEILNHFEGHQQTAIELGRELAELRQLPEGDRTQTQTHRIDELVQLEQDLNRQFNDFIDSDEILELINQLSVTTQQQTLNLADVNGLRDDLAQLNAVLLYPLMLDDRLELVITTPNAPPLRRTVDVSKEELNQTILEFRQLLQTPARSTTVPAQKLYRWLIEPLEQDLAAADINTIIYAPDAQLRYIPLAALHDGDRYLIEKYAVNNITARSLTNLDRQPKANPSVLAGAFADEEQVYPVQLGQRSIDFRGLPFAGEEVKTLTNRLPKITSFVDHEFSLEAVRSRLNEHDIIHFATHAAFVPGVPEDSFILFGNGDKSTLADVRNWSLQHVDLVVLSACQTGLGGFGNGEEILGLGYQFQRAGARAAIASLWQVSDRGTQVLMEAFYTALQDGYSKAEALRRAQQVLITGNAIVLAEEQGTTMEMIDPPTSEHLSSRNDLSHPYYWAPFILIGNGL